MMWEPLRVSYGCHKISKSTTSLDCNKICSDGVVRKDCMWELLGDSHAVAIQWVCMGADPLLCVCTNIVTILLPLVEAHGLKDRMYDYLTNLTELLHLCYKLESILRTSEWSLDWRVWS